MLLTQCVPLLGVVALIAGALWAGILFSVSWLSGRARWMADGAEVGSLAATLNRRWAIPCLVVSVTSAFLWLYSLPQGTIGDARLVGLGIAMAALVLLHSSVLIRASRVARGVASATRGEGMRRFMLVLSLAAFTTLAGLQLVWPR
jgi:hypothetical protein